MIYREAFHEVKNQRYLPLIFFILGVLLILKGIQAPINDFGNYYYGSKMLTQGRFTISVYSDIHYFNQQISNLGEKNFFENYIPVPPFSAVFYAPFCLLKCNQAKLLFNLLSLLLFCVSLFRLIKHYGINSNYLLILPLMFLSPLNNNLIQGQTYLLILAFISESLIQSEKGRHQLSALLCALVMALKIFPAFILLFYLLKKKYKVVIWSLVYFVGFNAACLLFIDPEIIGYYYTSILPRLANNDIIGAYYYGNQSTYSFLLNLFSFDYLQNPNALLNTPYLVPAIESLFVSLAIVTLIGLLKHNNLLLYGCTLLALILCSRYTTSYSLLLLLPLGVYLLNSKLLPSTAILSSLALLAIACSLNISDFKDAAIFIKFGRLLLLVAIFVILSYHFHIKLNCKLLLLLFLPIVAYRCYSFSIVPINYFHIQNTKGILYDISLANDSLVLHSTLGEKGATEKIAMHGKAHTDSPLVVKENKLIDNGKIITESADNKLNPFVFNDSLIVFMSDLNQAVRFYKLRVVKRDE